MSPAERPVHSIGHYRLVRSLGKGSFGEVFEGVHAHDPQLRVAVKVLHAGLAADADFVMALRAECRVLARLKHPNIVGFRDLVVSPGAPPAILLDLIEGGSLDVVTARGPAPLSMVVAWLREALSALGYAHQEGVVHRDIKPGNLLLDDRGRLQVVDFGIAKAADSGRSTKTGFALGTLSYMAPELFDGSPASPQSDLYALGLVAWELLAGRPACTAPTLMGAMKWHSFTGPAPVSTVVQGVPAALSSALEAWTAMRPEARPGSAEAALAMLRGVGEHALPTRPAGPGASPANPALLRRPPSTVALSAPSAAPAALPALQVSSLSVTPPVARASSAASPAQPKAAPPAQPKAVPPATPPAAVASSVAPSAAAHPWIHSLHGQAKGGPVHVQLARLPAGELRMGSPVDERGRDGDEAEHPVRLTRGIEVAVVPVTQALYQAVMGANPSHFTGTLLPVEKVSWFDAVRFCNAMSAALGLPAAYGIGAGVAPAVKWELGSVGFRLPTEAEWEFAARAGSLHRYSGGEDLDAVGWFEGNSGNKTRPVGLKRPNAWGLHDMSGNVWEWCWDWKGAYASGASDDPIGPAAGAERVLRGGSWYNLERAARVANRSSNLPGVLNDSLGFRLVRTTP